MIETIAEGKQLLRAQWEKGVSCPCCGQFVKLYKRKLNSNQARDLIRLYRKSGGNTEVFVHVSQFSMDRGGDFAKLAYWGLTTDAPNDDKNKRTSGMWRITEAGIDFVNGKSTVPKYTFTYNSKSVSQSQARIDIYKAIGTRFSYSELMRGL